MRIIQSKSRGSILIWTLLLGISLATVFFFFSQRLNASSASQRETIQYQNARLYFESYIAYIQSLSDAELSDLRDADDGSISFYGITGTLTNETDEIVGVLDMDAEVTYKVDEINGTKAKIEWNLCGEKGIMEITPSPIAALINNNCSSGGTYDGLSESNGSPFTLKNLSAPLTYRILPQGEAIIYDNEWQLDLELPLGFRKKLTTSVTFTPGS